MMRFALAVITGIGLEIFVDSVFHFSEQLLPVVAVLLLLSAALALSVDRIRKLRWMYRLRHAEGVLVLLATVSFGYLYTWLYAEENFSNHFQKYLNNQSIIVAQIIKPPLEKAKVINVVAQVQELKNTKGLHKTTGNILVNFLRDSTSANLQYGDVILFQAPI